MQDLGDLHALQLAVVLDLVHTAVHDRVVDIKIGLGIHDLGQVITAGSREKATHLDGQLSDLRQLLQLGRDGSEALLFLRVGIVGEVINRQARAVFDTRNGEAEIILDAGGQLHQVVALSLDGLCFALCRTGEVVQADDVDALVFIATTDDVEGAFLVHAELAAALDIGHAQQQVKHLASADRRVVDQLEVQGGFGGEGADVIVSGTFHIRIALVDAREDDGAHIHAGALANRQLTGGAYLDFVELRGHPAQ